MREITCINCGNKKSVKAWNAKTCSGICNTQYWRRNNKERNRNIKMSWRRKKGVLEWRSIEHRNKVANLVRGRILGENHPNWKGDDVSYRDLHLWVERRLGKANHCENNSNHISSRYHWANISGEYKRDISDWKQSCPSCNLNDGVRIHPRFSERRVSIL